MCRNEAISLEGSIFLYIIYFELKAALKSPSDCISFHSDAHLSLKTNSRPKNVLSLTCAYREYHELFFKLVVDVADSSPCHPVGRFSTAYGTLSLYATSLVVSR